MADGRANNGGNKNAGRKSKSVEQSLVDSLSKYDKDALKALTDAVVKGAPWALKLFMEYRHGKPKQSIEQTNVNYNQELTAEETERILKELHKKY